MQAMCSLPYCSNTFPVESYEREKYTKQKEEMKQLGIWCGGGGTNGMEWKDTMNYIKMSFLER